MVIFSGQAVSTNSLLKGKYMGKFAIGHRYFLAFAETHRSIMSLPGTITILGHIYQNTPPT
jgi:hypothetical protein